MQLKYLEFLHPKSLKLLTDQLQSHVSGRLWLKVLIAMFLGMLTGVLLGPGTGIVPAQLASLIGDWLALPGQLFLSVIQMIVVPLVFASIILGIASSENLEQLKKIGLSSVIFFVITTTLALVIGITLASIIKPGAAIESELVRQAIGDISQVKNNDVNPPSLASLPDKLVNMVPTNPLGAMLNLEMLQIVILAVIFGIALVSMVPKQSAPLLELLGSLQEVCMTIVRWAMMLAPIAVFGLMARVMTKIGFEVLFGMMIYVGTVLLGFVLLFVIYMLIYSLSTKQSPFLFIKKTRELLLLAFSTSSSAAVMPLSIKTAEEAFGVKPSISQFVIPLGATINMNGTALYQGVATIFLAQIFGVDLSLGALSILVLTAVGASIGSPATPGVGIVILSMVMSTVGIPAAGIALIMGVDRILDMSRTSVNVAGDIVAATFLDKIISVDVKPQKSVQTT